MARTKSKAPVPVVSNKHKDKRANIPTKELPKFGDRSIAARVDGAS